MEAHLHRTQGHQALQAPLRINKESRQLKLRAQERQLAAMEPETCQNKQEQRQQNKMTELQENIQSQDAAAAPRWSRA